MALTSSALLVGAVPSVPSAISANALALQQKLSAAASLSNPPVLTIEPGTYVFSNMSCTISNATNLVIEAHNANFVFYFGYGLEIMNCHNITIRGLTLDSDPPNYAQGVVVSSNNTTTSSFVAKFDERFIPPDRTVQPFVNPGGLLGAKIRFWDAESKQVLESVSVNFMVASENLGEGAWRIGLHNPQTGQVPIGSPVTIFSRRGETWLCVNSSNVVAEDVTIHAGGNMGFHEMYGAGGHTYRRVRIVRKANSAGLMALNAGERALRSRSHRSLDSLVCFAPNPHLQTAFIRTRSALVQPLRTARFRSRAMISLTCGLAPTPSARYSAATRSLLPTRTRFPVPELSPCSPSSMLETSCGSFSCYLAGMVGTQKLPRSSAPAGLLRRQRWSRTRRWCTNAERLTKR